jgi:hypothetical protein
MLELPYSTNVISLSINSVSSTRVLTEHVEQFSETLLKLRVLLVIANQPPSRTCCVADILGACLVGAGLAISFSIFTFVNPFSLH